MKIKKTAYLSSIRTYLPSIKTYSTIAFLFLTLLAGYNPNLQATEIERYLNQNLQFSQAELQAQHEQSFNHLHANRIVEAQQSMNQLLALFSEVISDRAALSTDIANGQKTEPLIQPDATLYPKALSNAAIIDAMANDPKTAIKRFNQAITLTESAGMFNAELFDLLMALASVQNVTSQYAEARQSLRRAQHISHRQDGVFSSNQLPIVESLVKMNVRQGNGVLADREQKFNLTIVEHIHGDDNVAILPTLFKLGGYFTDRGFAMSLNNPQTAQHAIVFTNADSSAVENLEEPKVYQDSLFRQSINLYRRSIAIIEKQYGANDPRLIEPLKGLSRAHYLQGGGRSKIKANMKRATEIITSNPNSDSTDQARSLVDLADTYVITSDSKAATIYHQAYQKLLENNNELLIDELFGTATRLFPTEEMQPMLSRHPLAVEVGEELYVDVQYNIRKDGRVFLVKVVDGNIPNAQKKLFKAYVSGMRYRPRMVNGELSPSIGVTLHQTFKVISRPVSG
ncbi:MAG: hypothetical protein KUG79_10740 [Pseudomonadales bacterium]|nr:hypothetical protein [Pseudomonadales bacterium]